MAYTTTHSITNTLRKAIDYICNPDKTDNELLVSSFACLPATADIEFEWTRKKEKIEKGDSLARHLIQSFAPGETTPEHCPKSYSAHIPNLPPNSLLKTTANLCY